MELLFAGVSLAGFLASVWLLKSSLLGLEAVVGPMLKKGIGGTLRAFSVGLLLTAVIQSSSATGAATVALAGAGVIRLRQAFAIILGANVGTTVTGQIVAFGTLELGVAFVAAGLAVRGALLVCRAPSRMTGLATFSEVAVGLGGIFSTLWCMGRFLGPIADRGVMAGLFAWIESGPAGALSFGVALTALIQSSSVTTGLLIGWVDQGMVSVAAGVAGALGCNVGTVTTSMLASISGGLAARRTAIADLMFNALGVVLVWPLLGELVTLVQAMSSDPGRQIAHAHTLFNLATAMLALPLIGSYCALIERMVQPRRKA